MLQVSNKLRYPLIFFLFLLPVYIILYKIYIPRVNAFGCFDDCFNIVAGYFISEGRSLYSEIFFNHQMLMAHISYLIQSVFHPVNIFELILRHRQFVLLFGFLLNTLIVLRFKFVGVGFVLFYEFSKFYLFGDRFLAEGLIVYPLVYIFGSLWEKLQNKKIYPVDYLLCAILAWFVIFMREPFIPLSLIMFTLFMWGRPFYTIKKIAIAIFVSLTGVTFLSVPLSDYIFNVLAANYSVHLGGGVFNLELLKIFFYPIFLFFDGEWNIFRHFLVGLSLLFVYLFFYFLFVKRRFKLCGIAFMVLALANLRVVPQGKIFYMAFHMVPWYGLFIAIIFLMLKDFYTYKKKSSFLIVSVFLGLFGYLMVSPSSYVYDKLDPHYEFITNYGKELQVGEVVRLLSEPKDTLFLDGADDLIYWQAKLLSPYKYSWYTSFMPRFSRYSQARLEMFKTSPPDFYYRFCAKQEIPSYSLPDEYRKDYTKLYSLGKPTCLYVKKTKIPKISKERWEKAKEFLYEKPTQFEDR